MKFAKVMFLHLSVSHSVHRGAVCLSAYWDTPSPPGAYPLPGADTPQCTVHAGRYGQQASGTHPTGMHTCYLSSPVLSSLNGVPSVQLPVQWMVNAFNHSGTKQDKNHSLLIGKWSLPIVGKE